MMVDPTKPKAGETLAYDNPWLEWRALAFYREGADARIVIMRGDELMVENPDYPAYKIYNVAAHLADLAESWESKR